MKNRHIGFLLALAIIFSCLLPAMPVMATEDGTETEEKAPSEMEINYKYGVDSNNTQDWPKGPNVYAKSAVVMDIDTGAILYEKQMDTKLYPASITKIMTTLLACENCDPRERVVFSDHAINSLEWGCTRIGIRVGEVLSMEDCMYGMMLASANEVCIGVAEHIAGSEEAFADMMNARAVELGCTNTHFVNPNGMPNEKHVTTAHDMALIAQAAYKNDLFREIATAKRWRIGWTNKTGEDRPFRNHHKMLFENEEFYYEYATGGKTGFTKAALNTLVTFAEKGGRRLVCVSMRTNGTDVYKDSIAMLKYGFKNFKDKRIYMEYKGDDTTYPAQLLGFTGNSDEGAGIKVTLAGESRIANLTCQTSVSAEGVTRTYSFNGRQVGSGTLPFSENFAALLSPDSTQTLRAREMPSLMTTAQATAEYTVVSQPEETDQVQEPADDRIQIDLPDEVPFKLPFNLQMKDIKSMDSWRKGLIGVLLIAILLYLILLVRAVYAAIVRRKRRRRRLAKKKAREAARKKAEKNREE